LPGAPGALLAIRLAAAAGDGSPPLGGVGALARGRELGDDDLVDQRHVHLRVEDLGGQLDCLDGRAGAVLHLDGWHFGQAPFAVVLTSTSPPLEPGTAPLMSSRPFSASTAWIARFCAVTRSPPIRPAIPAPLKTRL